MRTSIKYKIFGPLVACALVFGAAGFWYFQNRLEVLQETFLRQLAEDKAAQVQGGIEDQARRAVERASLFVRQPEVLAAFTVAYQGNLDDEKDLKAQEAREMLRKALGPVLAGYRDINGARLQLHYHLSNNRSLVRLWRDRQLQRDGAWVDVSDDLTGFRSTVVEVNRTGRPVQGIELGRGGFAVRGVVPVKDEGGRQLGSVEVLAELTPVLEAAARGQGRDMALFQDLALQDITGKPKEDQAVIGAFINVIAPRDKGALARVPAAFLAQAREELALRTAGNQALIGFPVKDYKGTVVGAVVLFEDITAEKALMSRLGWGLGVVLALILGLSIAIGSAVFLHSVQRPTRLVIERIKDIAEDRADLRQELPVRSSDEIGELCRWFNALMAKIDSILCETKTYVNIINALPDPVFAVDQDFRILIANEAVARLAGVPRGQVPGMRCADIFRTQVCGTGGCPIEQARRSGGRFQSEILPLTIDGQEVFIRPYADLLMDCSGRQAGYFEVASLVTDMVRSERKVKEGLSQMERLNARIGETARRMAGLSAEVSGQVDRVREEAEGQSRRVTDTATAMEQMNSTILEVARNAGGASEQAALAMTRAREGAEVVGRAVTAIGTVQELTEALRRNMEELGGQARDIGRIMNVITDIADQTNLLALNAAIEAARAGDAGRGFAVVADEVRKLAEKTMNATKEVGQAIGSIQSGVNANVAGMERAAGAVNQATELAGRSGTSLREIVNLVEGTSDRMRGIATAAEEQSATSEEINKAVEETHRVARDTAESMTATARAMEDLAALAKGLEELAAGQG